jgi:hypothetical protein
MRARLSFFGIGALCLGLAFATVSGCGSDDNGNKTGGGGSAGSGSGGSAGSAAGGAAGSAMGTGGAKGGSGGSAAGGSGGSSSGGGVSYEKDIKPIFSVKCAPCHTTTGTAAIFHTMASSYAPSATQPSSFCMGKKKGECTIVRIKSGQMPQGKGCKGDGTDTNTACLTKAEIDKVQAWVDGGIQP